MLKSHRELESFLFYDPDVKADVQRWISAKVKQIVKEVREDCNKAVDEAYAVCDKENTNQLIASIHYTIRQRALK
jgi:hypothetical protein